MARRTYLSIIILNINGSNVSIKDKGWLSGFKKKKRLVYVACKRLTSDLKTFTAQK